MAASQRRTARLSEPDTDGIQKIEGLSAAEAQEAEALGDFVKVPVGDMEVRVRPQGQWRMSDVRHLSQGDLDAWAEAVLHPDDYDDFIDLDITLDEFSQFSNDAAKASGDDLGKSRGRSGSSRTTRRR